jgi:ribosomal protein S18 acetylase RimI-like enzyme
VVLVAMLLLILLMLPDQSQKGVVALQVSSSPMIATSTTSTPFPIFGLRAILFPVRGTSISVLGDEKSGGNIRQDIDDATEFFVDAFWTDKVGGGTQRLSPRQRQQLVQSQQAEFNKRYGGGRSRAGKKQSAFLIMRGPKRKKKQTNQSSARGADTAAASRTVYNKVFDDDDDRQGEILACVGIEVEGIADGAVRGRPIVEYAPLMSNLAVSRSYRRRGLAECMVQAAEDYIIRSGELFFDEYKNESSLYLYVERRNTRAIQLYQKLGYRRLWQDGSAQTLLPMDNGDLQSVPTVLVCMKKDLKKKRSSNPFSRFFG